MSSIDKALAISEYQCDERTAELLWLAHQASVRKAIAEVGSWQGCTTRALADNTQGIVYAVDTWEGSPELMSRISEHPEGWLFDLFKKNMADLKNLKIMKMTSIDAAYDLQFNIIAWSPLLSRGGLLCGHDRIWEGVSQAINELVPDHRVGAGAIWYACV